MGPHLLPHIVVTVTSNNCDILTFISFTCFLCLAAATIFLLLRQFFVPCPFLLYFSTLRLWWRLSPLDYSCRSITVGLRCCWLLENTLPMTAAAANVAVIAVPTICGVKLLLTWKVKVNNKVNNGHKAGKFMWKYMRSGRKKCRWQAANWFW